MTDTIEPSPLGQTVHVPLGTITLPPVDVDKLDTAKPLDVIFAPYQTTLQKWEAKVKSLTVTDLSQKTEMAQARLARMELRAARVAMDKTRLGLVENLKARTGKIDATARIIREKMESLEAELLESEQFAERHAAKLKAQLKADRENELLPWTDTPIIGDLSELSEIDYGNMLAGAKLLRKVKEEAAAKVEFDRKAKEEAERVERVRLHAENTRLIAEAKERTRLAEIERKRIEAEREEERRKAKETSDAALAKAKAEADKRTKIAAEERQRIEEKAKADAEEAAKLKAELDRRTKEAADELAKRNAERVAADKAAREAAAAPDKKKLKAFAERLRLLEIPDISNRPAKLHLEGLIRDLAGMIDLQAEKL
jgi:hypothetical protein